MTGTNNASGLKWKTLAKKRRSATQGIPPEQEHCSGSPTR